MWLWLARCVSELSPQPWACMPILTLAMTLGSKGLSRAIKFLSSEKVVFSLRVAIVIMKDLINTPPMGTAPR